MKCFVHYLKKIYFLLIHQNSKYIFVSTELLLSFLSIINEPIFWKKISGTCAYIINLMVSKEKLYSRGWCDCSRIHVPFSAYIRKLNNQHFSTLAQFDFDIAQVTQKRWFARLATRQQKIPVLCIILINSAHHRIGHCHYIASNMVINLSAYASPTLSSRRFILENQHSRTHRVAWAHSSNRINHIEIWLCYIFKLYIGACEKFRTRR